MIYKLCIIIWNMFKLLKYKRTTQGTIFDIILVLVHIYYFGRNIINRRKIKTEYNYK